MEKYDLRRSCLQMLNQSVAAKDGGNGVPSIIGDDSDHYVHADTESVLSWSSKKLSGKKQNLANSKELADMAKSLRRINQQTDQLQKLEGDEKWKDHAHATTERAKSELHATKERISVEIDNLDHDKRKYEWELLMFNAKRGAVDGNDDPMAAAMHKFIQDINAKLKAKRQEVVELDTKLKLLTETPKKSNKTP